MMASLLLSTANFLSTSTTNTLLFNANHFNKPTPESNSTTTVPLLTGTYSQKLSSRVSFINLAVKDKRTVVTNKESSRTKKGILKNPILSEGRDEDESFGLICPGCGVFLQDKDVNLPGYFQKRKLDELEVSGGDAEDDAEEMNDIVDEFEEGVISDFEGTGDGEFDSDSEEWEGMVEAGDEELDGFAPAGVGYGNVTEEVIEREKERRDKKLSKSERKRMAREGRREKDDVTVCARCHSLRNYGQVKNQRAENLIPDFDFDRLITTRLIRPAGTASSTVVIMVVDCVDFDGSFPKTAAKSLFEALEGMGDLKRSRQLPKLVLVATKVDLLPSQISPTRLDSWVRRRARAAGAPKISGVFMVSSRKDLGVRNLLAFIKDIAGPRGNVWVIGAQNAGKSTLINALAKKGKANVSKLTEAPVPGTTLGILRIRGIFPAKAKMYDTPGLLHPYLMSMRLSREEQKMVEIRKELKPRTYRVKVGQAVHVGGLMRLDLNQASVQTIYISVWASPEVSLHMGKVENADEVWINHVGIRLQPPVGADRASELGKWEDREIKVSGTSWDVNSIDIAAAGLGWFSLGLKGEATLSLWTYDGIDVTVREPLVLDRAAFLERPGFLLPKAVSDAVGKQSKLDAQRKKDEEESLESVTDAHV